jgi:hypothetical protein
VQPSDAPRENRDSNPAFYRRRRRRDNELGQVLLRKGVITPEQLRLALKVQADNGGHIGAILRRLGACDSRSIAEALIEQVHTARVRGKARSIARRARENPSIGWLEVKCRPGLVSLTLILSDLFANGIGALPLYQLVSDDRLSQPAVYGLAAEVPLCLAAFWASRLYAV